MVVEVNKMRYPVTIMYDNKKVTVNVSNNLLQGEFALPDFLKAVRESKGHSIQNTWAVTDYPPQDCEDFESGLKKIPKEYLSCFTSGYRLPRKIIHLGYDPNIERKNILAERLKHLRFERDIPQLLFAEHIGISRGTYAKYETGINEPDLATLVKIADYYHVSLDYLAGRTN